MHHRPTRAFAVSAVVVCSLAISPVPSLAQVVSESAACNQATPEPNTFVELPSSPFSPVPTRDGCWVFVSLTKASRDAQGGVAVLRRTAGKVSLVRVIPTDGNPLGAVLTHDGKVLIVASADRLAFLDAGRMISGDGDAVLGYLNEGRSPGSIYVNVTGDDRFLFVSDEWAQTITVINLEKARGNGFKPDSVVGRIPTGVAPIALTFSPDERYLFTTSQQAPKDLNWPAECKPEGRDPSQTAPVNPHGAILIVNVARAKTDPASAVIATVPAGCSPVRLALSPKGDVAYVTARNNNALLAFDTGRLIADPAHALIGKVPVGASPVGVAVIDDGRKVIVTNSNRFAGSAGDKQNLTVIDAAKAASGAAAVLGTIPTGAFPREMKLTTDGRTLLVANFSSKTLQFIDLARLPLEPNKGLKPSLPAQ